MTENLANIEEFNVIAGMIFAQLYKAFPRGADIDQLTIATAMGLKAEADTLPSGYSFYDAFFTTRDWLMMEGYIRLHNKLTLTTKGLAAMNAVPSGRKPIGTELTEVVQQGSVSGYDLSRIGELIGGIFGGAIKTLSG